MSRLWSDLAAKLVPASTGTIGLGFCGDRIVAVCVERESGCADRIARIAEEQLSFVPFLDSKPSIEATAALTDAIKKLAEKIPQTYLPLQIAIPDPAVIFQLLEFDVIPETELERSAIAKFRLEKEFPSMTQMQCTTQVVSAAGEKGMLLVLCIQQAWMDCLKKACHAAGYVPSVIDTSMNHLLNFIDEKATRSDGLLISIEADTWSIVFWDAKRRPRYARSRWRDKGISSELEYEVMAQEIERLTISYVLRMPGSNLKEILLCANGVDCAPLKSLIAQRMKLPCTHLEIAKGFFLEPSLSIGSVPAGVLAATVQRA